MAVVSQMVSSHKHTLLKEKRIICHSPTWESLRSMVGCILPYWHDANDTRYHTGVVKEIFPSEMSNWISRLTSEE